MVARSMRIGMNLAASVAAVALTLALPAAAQADKSGTLVAPEYGSGVSGGGLSNDNFNTPEADGRPGVKFFAYGVEAFRKGDYRHAIDMYEVAASWAYKPAEYNLGVMYFKGQGVPVDRPRGAAWMILAAERGEPRYAHARDLMVTALTDAEFQRADAIWNELKGTFGDAVALRRAKAQWARAKSLQTGSRVGGATGLLRVGAPGHRTGSTEAGKLGNASFLRAGWGYLPAGSVDGSVAYRQFGQSDNPYDPVFLKGRTGKVTVEPLRPAKPDDQPPEDTSEGSAGTHPPNR